MILRENEDTGISQYRKHKKQYGTGEEPVLALCSDLNEYVCKYMRSSSTPYKLICEIIGAISANKWGLRIPDFALIRVLPEHWTPFRTVEYYIESKNG